MNEVDLSRILIEQYPVLAVLLLQTMVVIRYIVPLAKEAITAIVDFKVELACLRDDVRQLREAWQDTYKAEGRRMKDEFATALEGRSQKVEG